MLPRTISVRIPLALYARFARDEPTRGLSVARQAKQHIAILLRQPLAALGELPAPPQEFPGRFVSVSVNQEAQEQIKRWREHFDLKVEDSSLLSGLLLAELGALLGSSSEQHTNASRLDSYIALLGRQDRLAQQQVYESVLRRISGSCPTNMVLFAEASTGVGKTLAFLAAAMERLSRVDGTHGVVSCPTLQVMRQAASELAAVQRKGGELVSWGVIFGQREFVSEQALRWRLAEDAGGTGADDARAWMDAGGLSTVADTWRRPWLVEDLMEATAGAFDIDDSLRVDTFTAAEDAGLRSYKTQFDRTQQPRLILCTHSMLAREIVTRIVESNRQYRLEHGTGAIADLVRKEFKRYEAEAGEFKRLNSEQRRATDPPRFRLAETVNTARAQMDIDKARLPSIDFLIVDEAHEFETNVSNYLSQALSVWSLLHAVRSLHQRGRLVKKHEVQEMEEIYATLQGAASARTGETLIPIFHHDELGQQLLRLRSLLALIVDRQRISRRKRHEEEVRQLLLARHSPVLALFEQRRILKTYLRHSPVRHQPLIVSAQADVHIELDFLWSHMARQSVLISATLCLDGDPRPIEYMRRILGVPADAAEFAAPVRPAWLTSPVTLLLPAAGSERYRPVTRSDRFKNTEERANAHKHWLGEVAKYLGEVADSSVGGVLVLLTSYADCRQLVDLCNVGERPIVEVTAAVPIRQAVDRFLKRTKAGQRPMLFGVGAAWTGMNITGEAVGLSADRDNALTDLVIPRIPFGVNRSITHALRLEHSGSTAEAYATAFVLKQGLGRLVRREGLQGNRRIHLIDGRLNDPRFQAFLNPVRRVLSPYERRSFV